MTKRIILSEHQIKVITEQCMIDEIMSNNKEGSLSQKVKHLLMIGVAASTIAVAINRAVASQDEKRDAMELIRDSAVDSLFNAKVDALKKYMTTAAKNQGYNPEDIKLSPEEIVKASDETGFDLPFLVAAMHQESCFGLSPRSRRTNSVCNVGSYDNGRDVVKYPTQNSSIIPYIHLIQNDYLTDEKTLNDLLQKDKFVNFGGKRYASDKKYESKIKYLINYIKKNYPILAKKASDIEYPEV